MFDGMTGFWLNSTVAVENILISGKLARHSLSVFAMFCGFGSPKLLIDSRGQNPRAFQKFEDSHGISQGYRRIGPIRNQWINQHLNRSTSIFGGPFATKIDITRIRCGDETGEKIEKLPLYRHVSVHKLQNNIKLK